MLMHDLIHHLADLDEEKTLAMVKEKIDAGASPLEIVEQCRQGVQIVGERYDQGIYYLSDLIMSEEILRNVMEIVEPYFPDQNSEGNGTQIVMGTIEGDIHDLGKNIVTYLLKSHGFKVHDLGVDVTPETFVTQIKKTGAKVLGICVLLTFCIGSIKKVVQLLEEEGLRDQVTVVIGGYPVNQKVLEFTGADYCGSDVMEAVSIFQQITGKTK